jgi:hypothetical protein
MAGVPSYLPLLGNNALANYNYQDVASGLGYIDFYPTICQTDAGYTYALFDFECFGNRVASAQPSVYGATGTTFYFNATPFNSPRYAMGTAYLTTTLHVLSNDFKLTFTVYKVSGGASTSLGTATSGYWTSTANIVVPITITATKFKKGDYLQLKCYIETGTNASQYMLASPLDEASTGNPTTLRMPFRITI